MRTYREAGGNFIDTGEFLQPAARARNSWVSSCRDNRESIVSSHEVLQTPPPGNDPKWPAGNHRKNMMQAVEASLKAIADQLHRPVLGAHLGRDHACGRSHARSGRLGSPGQRCLYGRHLRTLPPGGSPRQIHWRSFEVGNTLYRACSSSTA